MRTYKILTLLLIMPTVLFAQLVNTEFTYQGELLDNGVPANGTYDIKLDAFELMSGGNSLLIFGADEHTGVTVTNGLFTIPNVEFGDLIFTSGPNTWIEISVKLSTGNSYTALAPRQIITSSPYAIKSSFSNIATLADSATTASNLTINGASSGDVLAYNGVNWASSNSLRVNGNGGTSIGTSTVPPSNGLFVSGDVYQSATKSGLPKYLIGADCGETSTTITGTDLTGNNGAFTIESTVTTGYCFINFPLSIVGNYWIVNSIDNDGGTTSCSLLIGFNNKLSCQRVDKQGSYKAGEFSIVVF